MRLRFRQAYMPFPSKKVVGNTVGAEQEHMVQPITMLGGGPRAPYSDRLS
jgi:hypothetical protein